MDISFILLSHKFHKPFSNCIILKQSPSEYLTFKSRRYRTIVKISPKLAATSATWNFSRFDSVVVRETNEKQVCVAAQLTGPDRRESEPFRSISGRYHQHWCLPNWIYMPRVLDVGQIGCTWFRSTYPRHYAILYGTGADLVLPSTGPSLTVWFYEAKFLQRPQMTDQRRWSRRLRRSWTTIRQVPFSAAWNLVKDFGAWSC